MSLAIGKWFGCALIDDGTVKCWGKSLYGTLGEGLHSANMETAHTVSSLSNVTQISSNQGHICAVIDDGAVKCWGWNSFGQLGNNTTAYKKPPDVVVGINNAIEVAAGLYHTCALLNTGKVMCWGNNSHGELGDGTQYPKRLTPVIEVIDVDNAIAISAGNTHTCVLIDNEELIVKCWGQNSSKQLGDGTTTNRNTAVTAIVLDQ